MKRNTPMHPKTNMLASMLGIPRYQACGILELLWHFTAQYAPAGDVGRRTNGQIAAFIDWPQDNANRLINALVECGWLDESPEHRLVVHDWHEHSDGTCDKYLADKGLIYATGHYPRRKTRQNFNAERDKSRQIATSNDSRARARVPESEPESESESPPNPQGGLSETERRFIPMLKAIRQSEKGPPGLTVENLAHYWRGAPPGLEPDDERFIAELRHALAGHAGRIGSMSHWLRARMSEFAENNTPAKPPPIDFGPPAGAM